MNETSAPDSPVWSIGPAGWYFLLVHVLLLPAMVLRARSRIVAGAPLPSKTRYYVSTLIQLTLLGAFSVWIAHIEWVPVFSHYGFGWFHPALALALLVIAVAFMRPRWKKSVERGDRRVQLISPQTSQHLALWFCVSLAAGIGEEITYRGVLTTLLLRLSGNFAIAAIASALLFGVVHMVQGWKSAAIIAVFALGFQAIAHLSGNLYWAMAVHVIYDVIAGVSYGRFARAKREREEIAGMAAGA